MRSRAARWSAVLALAVSASASASRAGPATGAGGEVTREAVEKAIRDGVAYLRRAQRPDGSWPGQPGTSELVILALLTAGEPADEPGLARALARSCAQPLEQAFGTYAVSLQTMALAAADPVRFRRYIARNAAWLEEAQVRDPGRRPFRAQPGVGSWSYHLRAGGVGDNSNSQYAVLGLNAAREAGVPVPAAVWA